MAQSITAMKVEAVKDLIFLLERIENKSALIDGLYIGNRFRTLLGGEVTEAGVSLTEDRLIYPDYFEPDDIGVVISETLTVEKLIWMLGHVDRDTFISRIRLKASSNMIFLGVGTDGLVIHD